MRRKYFTRNEWRERVNPAFARYWAATKKDWELSKIADPKRRQIAFRKNFQELAAASRELPRAERASQVQRAIMAGLDGEGEFVGRELGVGYITSPESSTLFRQLVFLKFGVTFRELMIELEHDRKAYPKLMRVHRDFHRLRAGEVRQEDLRLKFKGIHFQLMLQGLDFGLAKLNELELAACFDEICPCALRHSVEYLKKLRTSIKRACEHVLESVGNPTTIDLTS